MRAVVVAACLVAAVCAAPMVMIHKEVSEANVVLGGKVSITTTAINLGDEPANDFILEDAGKQETVESLLPQANVSITSTMDAANLGNLVIPSATATWAGEGNERARATSNVVREEERNEKRHAQELGPRGFINVVTAGEYERINSKYIKETILYLIFAGVVVGLPFVVFRQSQAQVDFHIKEDKKK